MCQGNLHKIKKGRLNLVSWVLAELLVYTQSIDDWVLFFINVIIKETINKMIIIIKKEINKFFPP